MVIQQRTSIAEIANTLSQTIQPIILALVTPAPETPMLNSEFREKPIATSGQLQQSPPTKRIGAG